MAGSVRFDPFRSLSDQELDSCIKSLAMQLASGATQVSSPDAGSVGYMTAREAERLLEKLERARASRLGLAFDTGRRISYTKVYIKQGDVR